MKKRLVRKAFDMILGISMSEDREVYLYLLKFSYFLSMLPFHFISDLVQHLKKHRMPIYLTAE